jgi:glycosyltransferase involved in cell wall biosynthesis
VVEIGVVDCGRLRAWPRGPRRYTRNSTDITRKADLSRDAPITVLQVIPRMRAGGAELGCLQVAAALVKAGHRALVASEGGRMVEPLEAAGAQHIALPLASKNPLTMAANARRLSAIVQRERVDVVHARSRAPAWSALAATRRTGTAFVTTYHSEYSERSRLKSLYNSVMVRSDTVIAVSHSMARLIRERYGTPEERVRVIQRAYDPARFNREAVTPAAVAAMRAGWQAADGEHVALLAGRITRRKAQHHFVEAMGLLKAAGRPVPLGILAGEIEKADFHAELTAHATALGVDDRVRVPGHVADMATAYAAADVLLNISEQEGLPRVALEAQAMGTPVIVSDTGPGREVALTAPDVAAEAATGLRVPYGEPARLAEALDRFFAMPMAERRAMGERASAFVRGHFSLEQLTSATLDVYQTVLARRRAKRT